MPFLKLVNFILKHNGYVIYLFSDLLQKDKVILPQNRACLQWNTLLEVFECQYVYKKYGGKA